jgi:ubiquinone/menaquinone biosynthesis C-methylase UbiE
MSMGIGMQQFFEEIADIYDETRGLPEPTMGEVIDVITQELRDCRNILELGVGTGRIALPLQKNGFDIVGIDLSKTMLALAQEKGFCYMIRGDVCTLPFKSTVFDAVISVHVLHLISDCTAVLREIRRVGKTKLISVVHASSDFHVRNDYEEALARFGYTLKTPGIGEWGLRKIAQPRRLIDIAPYEDVLHIGKRLELLEARKHSFARSIPEKIHSEAIEYLRDKYKNKLDIHSRSRIVVVIWDIDTLPVSIPEK